MTALIIAHKKLVMLGLTALTAASISASTMFTGALFTDQQTDQSVFTAGSVLLDAAKIAAMDLTSSAMMPGDTKTSAVTVENDGTAQLRYAVSQSSTNGDLLDLRDSLDLTVLTEDTGAGAFGNDGNYCDDASGTTVRASAAMGASGNLVGNPAQGAQGGERTLNAGANEVLCFYVDLPSGTGNGLQGASSTTTFTFAAEQTANN